jgi:hypothetical protein
MGTSDLDTCYSHSRECSFLPLVWNVCTALLSALKSWSTRYFFICFQHRILKLKTESQAGVTKHTLLLYAPHGDLVSYRSFINLHQDVQVFLCLKSLVSCIRRKYIKLFYSVDIYFLWICFSIYYLSRKS